MKTTRWNGDMSLLKDSDIASIFISFEKQTVSVAIRDEDYSINTGYHLDFTSVSPFGYFAKGFRRMVANELAKRPR